MKLNPSPFEKIQTGKKIIEIRLFDEKRQKVKLGDTIEFIENETKNILRVKVTALLLYPKFEDLVNDFSLDYFGFDIDDDKETFIQSMYTIYSNEEEDMYAVLGIKIKLLENI